jgi:hypothetical protein
MQDYHELHGWSVENYDLFWQEVWQFTGVIRQAGTFSNHRVHIFLEMKQGVSVSAHSAGAYTATLLVMVNVTPHPHQPGLILPS